MRRLSFIWALIFLVPTLAFAKLDLPERLEKGQLQKAEQLMQEVVMRYERARREYLSKGPRAFVESLSDKLPEGDKREIMQMLAKLPELPTLSVQNSKLIMVFPEQTLNFEVADVVLGKFRAENYNKTFNFNATPKENWDSFQVKVQDKSVSWQRVLAPLNFIFLPQAEALSFKAKDIGVIAVGALVGVVVLPKLFGVITKGFGSGGATSH